MKNSLPRMLTYITFAAALVATALVLSHCRMVSDSVTGVNLSTGTAGSRQDCIRNCHKAEEAAERAENQRFKDAKRACGSDKACRKAADLQHKQNLLAIHQQERQCRAGCYNEGAGVGGR